MKHFKTFQVSPKIPESLSFLEILSRNIWWCWRPTAIELFHRIDPKLWEKSRRNPLTFLSLVPQSRFEQLEKDDSYLSQLKEVKERFDIRVNSPLPQPDPIFKDNEVIAYLSMEFGLHESIPIFAGGLGILAGDHLKAASNMKLPLVGIGLLYDEGYFHQYLTQDGYQQEEYPQIDLYQLPLVRVRNASGNQYKITIDGPEGEIRASIWKIQVGRIPLYLLDTNLQENPPHIKEVTARLYGGGLRMRLAQEALLGIGGIKAMEILGLFPKVCHMNEGHSAFSSLERLAQVMEKNRLDLKTALQVIPRTTIFTTHTPVAAGHDEFPAEMVRPLLKGYTHRLGVTEEEILSWGQYPEGTPHAPFSMSVFGFRMAQFANGVSELHGEVARQMWSHLWPNRSIDEVPIAHVTNGVHVSTWISPETAQLFVRHLGPEWYMSSRKPENIERIDNIYDDLLWRAREICRARLVRASRRLLAAQYAQRNSSRQVIEEAESVLDSDTLTIGFGRRFATYKRAYLLFQDPDRLEKILTNQKRPVQIIIAGKAHPKDNEGKELIKRIVTFARKAELRNRIIFLENYDMHIARLMLQGADVWLNTPRRPFEACGTSGMKAAVNGVLNLSVLDGWWAEAYDKAYGWQIGNGRTYEDPEYQDSVESQDLYNVLEEDLIPAFYERRNGDAPESWIKRMKASMKMAMARFCSLRMVGQYLDRFYHPAGLRYDQLMDNNSSEARLLRDLHDRYLAKWNTVGIDAPKREPDDSSTSCRVGDSFRVTVKVHLGAFLPPEVEVQIYYGHIKSGDSVTSGEYEPMQIAKDLGNGDFLYESTISCKTAGRFGFTTRVIPSGDEWIRSKPGLITWN
jgi:glycogen phosphorylase